MDGTIFPCKNCGLMKYQHSQTRLICPRPSNGQTKRLTFESPEHCTFCTDSSGWIESDTMPGTYYPCANCNINKYKPLLAKNP